jgi:hypothetical protein
MMETRLELKKKKPGEIHSNNVSRIHLRNLLPNNDRQSRWDKENDGPRNDVAVMSADSFARR